MKIHIFLTLGFAVALAACAPIGSARDGNGEVQRLSFGQSVDIAAVGARLSTLRAGNGVVSAVTHSSALQAAAQAHAASCVLECKRAAASAGLRERPEP